MPEVTRNDVTLYYEDEGAGSPVLLIHGHTQDRRIWDPVMPGLREAGIRVIRPDLRGHGRSSRPDSGYHWIDHAADMAAVLDDAGVDSATVVGYSVGGGVALEMALTMAGRVGSLVLMSPVMPDRSFEWAFMENLKQVARVARADGIVAAMAGPWARSPLFEFSFSKPGVREAAERITLDFPGAEYLATERDMVKRPWTVPDRLAEIEAPTLVLVGDHETPGFRAWAEEAASAIPDARLDVLENCGHLLPLEEPDRVSQAIITLISERSNVKR